MTARTFLDLRRPVSRNTCLHRFRHPCCHSTAAGASSLVHVRDVGGSQAAQAPRWPVVVAHVLRAGTGPALDAETARRRAARARRGGSSGGRDLVGAVQFRSEVLFAGR